MSRILLAFRAFFAILFGSPLPPELTKPATARAAATAKPEPPPPPSPAFALQLLAILQRDSRLVDFLMEDVSAYEDEQIGAAVRSLHDQARDSLARYLSLQPVIDGVEGAYTRPATTDPVAVKFIGNVPAGKPEGGVLRHKGWRAAKVDLPAVNPKQDATIIAPAEIEIE
ncbi:MAG: DUF2760 domain-containing protein [Bryobacteraceae bacterium]